MRCLPPARSAERICANVNDLAPVGLWDELVFTTSAGTPIDPSNYRRLIKDVAQAAGLGHLAPYDLRHTAASLLSDAGVPNHELADLLGHTTTRMVEVHYRHRLKKTIDVAVTPMQRLVTDDEGDAG